jgi:DMSO/TMAO reductase YedYZ molybdopterin-dependent catalytic subunit
VAIRQDIRTAAGGGLCGLLGGAAGVAVAQLAAAIIRPEAGPLVTVGGSIVDATPTPLKEFAIRQFGTNDKLVLMLSIAAVLAAFAVVIGILGIRWRRLGLAGAGVFGLIGVLAAATRPAAHPVDIVPAVLGGVAAVAVLALLLRARDPGAPAGGPAGVPGNSRRAFLRTGGLVALGAAVLASGGYALSSARTAGAAKLRAAVRLPAPSSHAGARNTTAGFYTPNTGFYRVDTALTVPRVDPDTWRLRIHGMLEHPTTLDFAALTARPAIERDITLNCVSNEVGGPYIGTARWLGIPLAPLLREAGVRPGADQIVARSVDGMTIGTPVTTALDGRDTMLAIGMNGEPLPLEHGFPVRMLTPGLYGYVGACKWITDIEVTRFDAYDPYWVKRGWAKQAPVKTASRIDRPQPLSTVPAGTVRVAGVAWAQHRGIGAVEVQVDDRGWQRARVLPTASLDTWVQWTCDWQADKGEHQIRVRATDGTGAVQTDQRAGTFPSGATGWHTIAITVG